ncbi:MAG: dihydropteroate synthase [Verrucomicrobiota bacterium]
MICDSRKPLIMGILNVTPDSFSDGGQFVTPNSAAAHALEMEQEGADLIDIGGESTRPNAEAVSAEEELKRVIPVIQALRDQIKIPISIDTTKSIVARAALEAGAEIVNDVSAGEWDLDLLKTVVDAKAGYVLMHAQGNPRTMQRNPCYEDVTEDVYQFLEKKLKSVEQAGIPFESMVIDMGFGFGKTMEHNLSLLKNVKRFNDLNRPILLGLSRKSFLRNLVNASSVEIATANAHFFGSLQGASLWRVHDVSQAVATRKMLEALV